MNKITLLLTPILACGLLALPARAQFTPQATAIPGSVPEGMNYQGRLEDGGFPVNATKTMVFRVYSALTGGVLLWTSPAQSVSVSLGLFNAVIPVPVTTLVGGGARYLEVQIDSTLMSPRELLNSVPYALIAKSVEGTIDVSTAGLSVNANGAATQPALYISSQTGNVGVGTGSPATSFDVGGSAQFGSGTTKSTFTAAGSLTLANNAAFAGSSSVTASGFFGSAMVLTGPESATTQELLRLTKVSFGGTIFKQYYDPSTAYGLRIEGTEGRTALVTDTSVNPARVGIGVVLLPKTTLDVNGNAQFGSGVAKSTFSTTGALTLASNAAFAGSSSVTASGFFGSAAVLTGPESATTQELLRLTKVSFGGTIFKQYYDPSTAYGLQIGGTEGRTGFVTDMSVNPARVGIGGVLLPKTTLDVEGNAQFGAAGTKSTFTTTGSLTLATGQSITIPGTAGRLNAADSINVNTAGTNGAGVNIGPTGTAALLSYNTNGNLDIAPRAGFNTVFTAGSVGVGAASPAAKLHMSSGTFIIDGNTATSLTTTGSVGVGTAVADTALHVVGASGGTALTLTDNVNATLRFSFPSNSVAAIASNEGAHSLAFGGQSSAGGPFTERFRINNVTGNSTFPSGNIGIGTGVATPNDRLEVASGNIRLTAVAGSAGSVKLFSAVTAAATTCTTQCGVNSACLAAWDSTGVVSTCVAAALANRCLCSGFGD